MSGHHVVRISVTISVASSTECRPDLFSQFVGHEAWGLSGRLEPCLGSLGLSGRSQMSAVRTSCQGGLGLVWAAWGFSERPGPV